MPTSTRTTHIRFLRNVAANLSLPNGRTEASAPTGRFTLSPCTVRICFCIPRGVEPLPYATGIDFMDSHWRVPIFWCVPHNPFVTASPCHLPLHKGGFGAPRKNEKPAGRFILPAESFISASMCRGTAAPAWGTAPVCRRAYRASTRSWKAARTLRSSPPDRPDRVPGRCC